MRVPIFQRNQHDTTIISGDDAVAQCKQRFADAIDQMNDLRNSASSPEVKRMASVAITEMQTAQMWAVKALTWQD